MVWMISLVRHCFWCYDLLIETKRMVVRYSKGSEDAFHLPDDVFEHEIIGDKLHVVLKNQDGGVFVFSPHRLTNGDSALLEYQKLVEQDAASDR